MYIVNNFSAKCLIMKAGEEILYGDESYTNDCTNITILWIEPLFLKAVKEGWNPKWKLACYNRCGVCCFGTSYIFRSFEGELNIY